MQVLINDNKIDLIWTVVSHYLMGGKYKYTVVSCM